MIHMPFESIVITGTSCSGKSTIAKGLCNLDNKNTPHFKLVEAVTTREKRKDDTNYDYITDEYFNELNVNNKLLISSVYREKKYGLKFDSYREVLSEGNIPILIITPSSAAELLSKNSDSYLCIFLDSPDDILTQRFEARNGVSLDNNSRDSFIKQNINDRSNSSAAHYIISNNDELTTMSLILWLWKNQYKGGGLPQRIIKDMVSCDVLLKNADPEMIKGASYDLCLGDEYYYDGEIQTLSAKKPFLTIEPYDYAIVSCKESACIPRDVIAKFGLSVGLFCQGIILSNGPQIDPGFSGTLFCLLFNTSNRAVHLKRGQHYATIEFNKLVGYADPYSGRYQGKEHIIDYIPANALHGAINELKKEVEKLKRESRYMQNIYLGVVALMFAIISILLVVR